MRFHLARMLAREAGTRDRQGSPRSSTRCASRRAASAPRGGSSATSFRPARTKRYRNGLREIARRLGAVRDLDVLLEAADAVPGRPAGHRAAGARAAPRRLAGPPRRRAACCSSASSTRTAIGAGSTTTATSCGPRAPRSCRSARSSRTASATRRRRASGPPTSRSARYEPVLRWADVETLHELRIAGKWLRYTLEFVREALGPESAPLIARVTALQDHLGPDERRGRGRIDGAGLPRRARRATCRALESAAIGRYLVSREREVARLRRTIGGPWRGVAGIGFRRALGRVVAGL